MPIHNWSDAQVWNEIYGSVDGLAELNAHRDLTRRWRQRHSGAGLEQIAHWLKSIGYPAHPAYALGNERLSCALCVLGSVNDIENGAEWQPDTYRELVDIEIESGYSFRQNLWLKDLRPDLLTEKQRIAIQAMEESQS